MKQQEILNKVDMLAAMAAGTATHEGKAQLVLTTVRLPIWITAKVDALAKQLGKSRAATIAFLLDVGLEELHQRLDEATQEKLMVNEAEAFEALSGGESTSGSF